MNTTELLLAAMGIVVAISVAELIAERTGLPAAVLLTLGGLAYASMPGTIAIELEPHVVLAIIIPALLYSAAVRTGLRELKVNARPIGLLSVGLVIVTAVVVTLLAKAFLPGVTWPGALALGAVVAPTDAVSALAVARRVGMPERLVTILSGESLLNDATALTILGVALEASSGHNVTALKGLGLFALATLGGVAIGIAVAFLVGLLRRRIEHPLIENALSLITPALAFLPAEEIHASGVLAVVVCGLVLGRQSPRHVSGAARIQTRTVWDLVNFVLEGFTFLVLGMQLPALLDDLGGVPSGDVIWGSVLVLVAVLVIRPLWIIPFTFLPRRLSRRIRERDPAPSWQTVTVLSWAGMRGVVTVAGAFTIPAMLHDDPFPGRPELQFAAFMTAAVTLLLQGTTLGIVVRRLGLRPDEHRRLLTRAQALHRSINAGVAALDELLDEERSDGSTTDPLRSAVAEGLTDARQRRSRAEWERLGRSDEGSQTPSEQWRELRLVMIGAERESLLADRDSGLLTGPDYSALERELDFEERGLAID